MAKAARRPWGSAQRKGGQWYSVYTPHKGAKRRVWEPVHPNTRTRALDVLAQRQTELSSGGWDDPTRVLTFRSLVAEWMATMRTSWRPQTLLSTQGRMERTILPVLGDMDVRNIDGPMLQRLLVTGDLAPRTVRLGITLARQALQWGHRHGRIRVLRDLTVTLPAVPRSDIDPLTCAEVGKLLDNALEYRPVLMWAVLTGMRQGEILAAKWRHLDAEKGTYHVCANRNRAGEIAATKTSDVGDVWVPNELLDALEDQRKQNAVRRLAATKWQDSDAMFPGPHGGHGSQMPLIRAFHRSLEAAGLRRRPFHHLRHTCASLLIDQGETILTVQHQLRHRQASITLDTYSHMMPDAGAAALQRLAGSIGA